MKKSILALTLALLVAGCGAGNFSAPRDLDNACRIVEQRPTYLRAFKATERKWGVPVATLMAMIYQESKFIGNARPPHQYALSVIPTGRQSSAYGYSQALDGTWEEYLKAEGRFGAKRDNIRDATDFMGWYMTATQRELGIALNDTENQYLAYHDGRAGYRRGTYKDKAWLVRVASGLKDRAIMYDGQLRRCGKI